MVYIIGLSRIGKDIEEINETMSESLRQETLLAKPKPGFLENLVSYKTWFAL